MSKHRRPLVVLVDLDCVLADFEGHFLTRYRAKFPDEPYIPLEERNTFYISDQYCKFGEDIVEKTNSIIYQEGFFDDIPPITEGIDAVKEMSGLENVEVFICTSPVKSMSSSSKEKVEWVRKYMGYDWLDRLVLARDKTIIFGDMLIDDKPRITGQLRHPPWKHILFTACHNKHLNLSSLKCHRRLDGWLGDEWKALIQDFQKQIQS